MQVNNALINRLLLSNDSDSLEVIKDILGHLLHIVDLKGLNLLILSVLTKVIAFIKTIEEEEVKTEKRIYEEKVYAE